MLEGKAYGAMPNQHASTSTERLATISWETYVIPVSQPEPPIQD
jgi:hypothetical protein